MNLRLATAVLSVLVLAAVAGCHSSPSAVVTAHTTLPAVKGDVLVQVGQRPVTVHVPASYDPATPVPLVMMLHGRGASGSIHESYFKIIPESDRRGFIYAMPDGTEGPQHVRFWNATDACCAPSGRKVDDSAYLTSVIRTIQQQYAIDPSRIYLVGLSNGAFMSYRMACDHADLITAIAALNGAMWRDIKKCRPSHSVGVLEIHSQDDQTIRYNGGTRNGRDYPSSATTVADWVRFNGCQPVPDHSSPAMDYIEPAGEVETSISRYAAGPTGSSTVEFWAIRAGGHVPTLRPEFATAVLDYLYSQQKAL